MMKKNLWVLSNKNGPFLEWSSPLELRKVPYAEFLEKLKDLESKISVVEGIIMNKIIVALNLMDKSSGDVIESLGGEYSKVEDIEKRISETEVKEGQTIEFSDADFYLDLLAKAYDDGESISQKKLESALIVSLSNDYLGDKFAGYSLNLRAYTDIFLPETLSSANPEEPNNLELAKLNLPILASLLKKLSETGFDFESEIGLSELNAKLLKVEGNSIKIRKKYFGEDLNKLDGGII